ncbi:M48 family metallopeptidase [Flavobacterium sp. NRK F10]|uniref:M48 family metallopeptidase n=1 Tax=Flavobacterium sp. NRK F10 TaxID=2954931 RepID=UPI002090FFF5|nr:M48 family metallopeptidase [Flavobacterium sp. NRK F10]MCO6174950.1 M48 family metallopeptidase [Flavobacterium sp. NRK F10]
MNTAFVSAPKDVPKDLVKLPKSYMLKATLAIFSIFFFFILYISLVTALCYLVYWAITYDVGRINKLTILMKVGAIAGSVMLLIFTFKFIFKLKNVKPENRIKLSKEEYPQLYSFIEFICKEANAPKPKNIFIDPDVNAYVSYTNVWLSLFFPTRKELTIGLGLVSTLNVSEFKAVIAHEFGHFSQRSMKIGSYIHSANTIIHDMIYNRDSWDDFLDQWRSSDIRLSFAAWVITPLIWIIRNILKLFYLLLNRMNSLLSLEMEFNADKVAVKVAGSESIVSALWKLEHGFTNWNAIIDSAYHASKNNIYSANLYNHNDTALAKSGLDDKKQKLPSDEFGNIKYFSGHENAKVSMYATHPPGNLREANAKSPFIKSDTDGRPAWVLFDDKEKLQEQLTLLVYNQYLGKKPNVFATTEEFDSFLETENQDNQFDSLYEETFLNRFISIPSFNDLENQEKKTTLTELKEEIKRLMVPVKETEALMKQCNEIASGTTKQKEILYKDVKYTKKTIQTVYDILLSDRERMFNENFVNWDKDFVSFFYGQAKQAGKEKLLLEYYEQHQKIVDFYRHLLGVRKFVLSEINRLQQMGQVTQQIVDDLSNEIKAHVKGINAKVEEFDNFPFVVLPNINSSDELKKAIFEKGKMEEAYGRLFENNKINVIMGQLENAIVSCGRVEKKSWSTILKYQESLC